jgi:hypothetical protein
MITEANDPFAALSAPTVRTPRSLETRDTSVRKRSWVEPSLLPDPAPQDGYVFKWVRVDGRRPGDNMTIQKRMGEGWEPVEISEHPEIVAELHLANSHGRVERGGLILCKMPESMVQERSDHYRGVAKQQESSAEEHYMRDPGELVKKFSNNSRKIVFGPSSR